MFCFRCGTQIRPDSEFCFSCGAQVPKAADSSAGDSHIVEQESIESCATKSLSVGQAEVPPQSIDAAKIDAGKRIGGFVGILSMVIVLTLSSSPPVRRFVGAYLPSSWMSSSTKDKNAFAQALKQVGDRQTAVNEAFFRAGKQLWERNLSDEQALAEYEQLVRRRIADTDQTVSDFNLVRVPTQYVALSQSLNEIWTEARNMNLRLVDAAVTRNVAEVERVEEENQSQIPVLLRKYGDAMRSAGVPVSKEDETQIQKKLQERIEELQN